MPTNNDNRDNEGGAAAASEQANRMSGTVNQVEWAQKIKRQVSAEFDRVAALLRTVALRQEGEMHDQTESVIAILEEKRAGVMARNKSGYFIHDWQEITDQVRILLIKDPRYQEIKLRRSELRNPQPDTPHADDVPLLESESIGKVDLS